MLGVFPDDDTYQLRKTDLPRQELSFFIAAQLYFGISEEHEYVINLQ